MPRCTPALPPPEVSDAVFRTLPLLEGITRVTLHRVEWWDRGALRLHWLGQCRDCLTVYWCDTRGEEMWPPQG